MKKTIYISLSFLIIAGCDKKLNQTNPNTLTTGEYWKTRDEAYAGVTAIYNALILDGTYMRSFPNLTDSRGDDFYGESPWLDLNLTGQFVIPSDSEPVAWIWRDLYLTVTRANQVIYYVSQYNENVLPADEKNRILGQAYFLRGLAYYNLATTFKIVPVITQPPLDASQYYPSTASEDILWNQVFSDLSQAEADLPISYDDVTGLDQGQTGRATKGAAAGLLGKAYLYRKHYDKAAAQFEKFLTGELKGVYSLVPDYGDNFKDINENNSESLFEIQFQAGEGTDFNFTGEPSTSWKTVEIFSITYGMEGVGFSDYLPTRWIFDEYKKEKTVNGKDDPRLNIAIAHYDPASGDTLAYGRYWFNPTDRIYPSKYTYNRLGPLFEAFDKGGINYRVLRYADILLMYAETLNELNRTAEAYPYIKQVRQRAGLPDLAITKPNMNQQQMRDQLDHERALEFAIEAQRINDIIRWGWLYDPVTLAELKSHDPDYNTWTPGNEYLPVPQKELDINPNLSPNPAN